MDKIQNKRPSHDQTMMLLGGIMATYSWTAFKPILYSPENLQAWITANLKPDPDSELMLHPDDPKAAEMSELALESEDAALEFLGEINKEQRELFREAFRAMWGPKGAASLPIMMQD